jgi:hypothetical protein
MSWAELGGQRIMSGSITIPWYGACVADVVLASSAQVDPQTTLMVGNLSLIVHAVRQASFAGSRGYRVVGGYGGWRQTVGPRYYASPASLPLVTVLADIATEVHERIDCPASRVIGPRYARVTGLARQTLDELAPDWWLAPDGVTHVGARVSEAIATPLTVVSYSGGHGRFQIATEDMAAWQPGRTFVSQTIAAPVTIGSVIISIANEGKVRLDVLSVDATTAQDRIAGGIDAIIAAHVPLAALGVWECTVVAVHGTGPWTLDVVPTSALCPIPGMTQLDYSPALAGSQVKPSVGSTCRVAFANVDLRRPEIVRFDGTVAELDFSADTDTGAAPPRTLVRVGDVVTVGAATGAIAIAGSYAKARA